MSSCTCRQFFTSSITAASYHFLSSGLYSKRFGPLRMRASEGPDLIGEDHQICFLGCCLLITNEPFAPRLIVSTPF